MLTLIQPTLEHTHYIHYITWVEVQLKCVEILLSISIFHYFNITIFKYLTTTAESKSLAITFP